MQFYSGGLPMQAQDRDFIYTTGVVRLENKDGHFSGRWGIGRTDVTEISVDPDSPIVLEKDGFALLNIKVCYAAAVSLARPVDDPKLLKQVLVDLNNQLLRLQDSEFSSEISIVSNRLAERFNFSRPVMVVMQFKNKDGDFRCFHGYGLANPDDIVGGQMTTYGSKVKGATGVTTGWQMVLMFASDKTASRFVAVPTERQDFIQLAIDGLKQQLEVAIKYQHLLAQANDSIDQADLG